MNAKMRAFTEFYASCANATEAARKAGYSERTCYSIGQRLLKNVEIKNYLSELQERLSSQRIADASEVQSYWTQVLRDGSERTGDRLRAGQLLTRSAGQSLPQSSAEAQSADDEPQSDDERVLILLPAKPGTLPTAAELPNGEIVPLFGHEKDDLLLYAPFYVETLESLEMEEDD